MNRYIANGIGLSAMGALCITGWAAYQVGATVRENRAEIRTTVSSSRLGLADVFAESRDVTIALLKPCKAGKPATCGMIPAAEQVAQNTGAAVSAIQTQVAQTQPLIQNAALAVQTTSEHLNKTVDAVTQTTLQARVDLVTLNDSIGATKPLLEAYTRSGVDLNGLLEGPALRSILSNTANMTGSGAGIMADGKKVTDQATADYLNPKPWYRKVGRYAGDAFDYGALFARHTP
jgi:hypothetical protein